MSRSVLVVDDDARFRELAGALLTAWGYRVVGEAATCAQALERVTALHPDAALVDVGLPDGDGLALARRLGELDPPPRVVLISAGSDDVTDGEARRCGAGGFLRKDELSERTLRALLEGAGRDG